MQSFKKRFAGDKRIYYRNGNGDNDFGSKHTVVEHQKYVHLLSPSSAITNHSLIALWSSGISLAASDSLLLLLLLVFG